MGTVGRRFATTYNSKTAIVSGWVGQNARISCFSFFTEIFLETKLPNSRTFMKTFISEVKAEIHEQKCEFAHSYPTSARSIPSPPKRVRRKFKFAHFASMYENGRGCFRMDRCGTRLHRLRWNVHGTQISTSSSHSSLQTDSYRLRLQYNSAVSALRTSLRY